MLFISVCSRAEFCTFPVVISVSEMTRTVLEMFLSSMLVKNGCLFSAVNWFLALIFLIGSVIFFALLSKCEIEGVSRSMTLVSRCEHQSVHYLHHCLSNVDFDDSVVFNLHDRSVYLHGRASLPEVVVHLHRHSTTPAYRFDSGASADHLALSVQSEIYLFLGGLQ
jgi:hypothetical protein